MLPIARKKKPDWNEIKAEYISGGGSMRSLSEKHKVPFATLRARYEREGWKEAREKARQEVNKKTAQRVANAAASNAVKLEKARAMMIDKLLRDIEKMVEKDGTRIRQSKTDKQSGVQLTVDYDLAVLVGMFEKLSSGTTADYERQKQFAEENNTVMMSYADLFRRAARQRTIEQVEAGGDGDV